MPHPDGSCSKHLLAQGRHRLAVKVVCSMYTASYDAVLTVGGMSLRLGFVLPCRGRAPLGLNPGLSPELRFVCEDCDGSGLAQGRGRRFCRWKRIEAPGISPDALQLHSCLQLNTDALMGYRSSCALVRMHVQYLKVETRANHPCRLQQARSGQCITMLSVAVH